MNVIFFLSTFLLSWNGVAPSVNSNPKRQTIKRTQTKQANFPSWFSDAFKKHKLHERYELKTTTAPRFLQCDLNGDNVLDVAAIVTSKINHKTGILLIHGETLSFQVFGAGSPMSRKSEETADFKWIDGWQICKDKRVYETKFDKAGDIIGSTARRLSNPGIRSWALSDGEPIAGGVITWNGKRYIWIHEGE